LIRSNNNDRTDQRGREVARECCGMPWYVEQVSGWSYMFVNRSVNLQGKSWTGQQTNKRMAYGYLRGLEL